MNPDIIKENVILKEERDDLIKESNRLKIIKENVILKEERDDLIKENNRLNGLFMGAVMELNDLKQPWYVKLWNKLPRISIKIERGA